MHLKHLADILLNNTNVGCKGGIIVFAGPLKIMVDFESGIMKFNFINYVKLTKPRIMLLIVLSGMTALIMEGSLVSQPGRLLLALIALYLTGGAANALNNYFERDIDKQMTRTKAKRPLPLNQISPRNALYFSIGIGAAGVLIFALFFNWLSAGLSLATILFYSLFYTLFLKPATRHNVVIGGVAGAMAPVGMWAAASGRLDIAPWTLFLIIFFWSPPHFWALAIRYRDDYKKTGMPMLPLVKGDDAARKQIFIFSIILFFISLTPYFATAGLFYLCAAVLSGVIFILQTLFARRHKSERNIRAVFGYSIVHLFIIFFAILIDHFIYY